MNEALRIENIKQSMAKLQRSISPVLQSVSLDSFCISEDVVIGNAQRSAIDHAKSYIEHASEALERGVNLILYGAVGTGKDHILSSVATAVIPVLADDSVRGTEIVRHINGPSLWQRFRAFIGEEKSETEQDVFREFCRPKILYISDPFQTRSDGTIISLTDWQIEKLYEIVEYRYGRRLPIFMSINCNSRHEIEQAFNARIADRLLGNSIPIHCSWPSYRRPFTGWNS